MNRARNLLCMVVGAVAIVSVAHARASEWPSAGQVRKDTGIGAGLAVVVGATDGQLEAQLAGDGPSTGSGQGKLLVHGMAFSDEAVIKARQHISQQKLYGPASVERLTGQSLPYTDNLVNLLVSDDLGEVTMDEVLRVLAPSGIAYLKRDGVWTKVAKPRPPEIDDWTHSQYDASGNAISRDRLAGPPRRLQWTAEPKWTRHHESMSGFHAAVSAGGRIFSICDEGPAVSLFLPPYWGLVARDAFNGKLLWRKPIPKWFTPLRSYKSGPANVTRLLVATDRLVFTTLEAMGPLAILDAATGEILRTCAEAGCVEEIIHHDGTVYVVAGDRPRDLNRTARMGGGKGFEGAWAGEPRSICAIEAATGKLRWKQSLAAVPMTLAANRRGVFVMDRGQVVCLNPQTGQPVWRSTDLPMVPVVPLSATPTLVLTDQIVLVNCGAGSNTDRLKIDRASADNDWKVFRLLVALGAENGEKRWECELPPNGYQVPKDILVADGLVWTGAILGESHTGTWEGRDLLSGEVKRSHTPQWKKWFHQRCYRSRGTERFLMPSRTGVEMISPADGYASVDHWVRGACLYGNIPANGLFYATPHPCGCFMEATLHGYSALAPERTGGEPPPTPDGERLWQSADLASAADGPAADAAAWPCYRHDNQRSSRSAAEIPVQLAVCWKSEVGGRLTAPVIAGGMLFLASVDAHTLYALDAETGQARWQQFLGGRIDSPPTYFQGRLFVGTRDGFIHCVRASDGAALWRYQAAPRRQLVLANEQLESAWPVHGSVLVREDRVYAVAGRSAFLDGGMRFLVLDALTGRKIAEETIDRLDPQTSKDLLHGVAGCTMPPGNPDILSDDGQFLYMKSQRFDAQGRRPEVVSSSIHLGDQYGAGAHLFSAGDLLDGNGFHRVHMIYGKSYVGGHTSNHSAPKSAPSGVVLAFDDSAVYGFGRQQKYYKWTRNLEFHVFSASKAAGAADVRKAAGDKVYFHWSKPDPAIYATAIALTPSHLFLAGPPAITVSPYKNDEAAQEDLDRWQGRKGGKVVVYATADGAVLAESVLPSLPVWDGMAAAGGCLYVSGQDGRVYCLAGDRP